MHWAAKRNHSHIVEYLLENGADKDIEAHDKSIPAHVCSNDSLRQVLQSTASDSKRIFFFFKIIKIILNNLDHVAPSLINKTTLPIIPNYLRHPVFPYVLSQPTPTPSISDNQIITLLCRIADNPSELDFVEFDFNKTPNTGSFERLLSLICRELDLDHIDKLRRLPCIRIRNDRDIERLKDNHMLEVILIKTSS